MRLLNSVEKAWLKIGEHGSANAVRCFCVAGPLHFKLVERAFSEVVKVFPILRARIVSTEKGDAFLPTDHAPHLWPTLVHLTHHSGMWTSAQISKHVEDLLNQPINPRREPLFQFVFLESKAEKHWFLINFHHAISDGATNVALMKVFLSFCEAALVSESAVCDLALKLSAIDDWSPSLTGFFPTQSVVSKTAALLSFLGRRLIKEATYRSALLRVPSVKTADDSEDRKTRSCAVQYSWDASFAEELRICAKKQNLTVHALFSAALMMAFKSQRFSESRVTDISCVSFVNMRNQCVPAISDGALGCYISAAFSFHHVSEQACLLSLARDLSAQLKLASQRDVKQQAAYAAYMTEILIALGRKTVATLSVSNIGNVSSAFESRNFSVAEVHVHSALTGIGSSLSVGLTSTKSTFAFDFTFIEGVLNHEEVSLIALTTRSLLEKYMGQFGFLPVQMKKSSGEMCL